MGRLEIRGVDKSFGGTRALAGVDLAVGPGEILGVTGPSGAGKTTLCRVIAGLEVPAAGEVRIDGRPLAPSPERRGIAFMFESYALYPQLTVFDNVAFPLRAPAAPRLPPAALAARVREVLAFAEIDGLAARRPAELSGGQKQRVALCRALVQAPRARLLDEPVSHLDAKLRHVLRGAIRRRLTATDVPTVWTSPDALEALAVADRVAVLVGGRLAQVAPSREVYCRPATVEVARLVGDPPMNLLEGMLAESGGVLRFEHEAFRLPLPRPLAAALGRGAHRPRVVLGLRPSDLRVGGEGGGATRGEAWVWEPLGKHGILTVRLGRQLVKVKLPRTAAWSPGDPVALDLAGAEPLLFDGVTGAALPGPAGDGGGGTGPAAEGPWRCTAQEGGGRS